MTKINSITIDTNCFSNNITINSVDLGNAKWTNNSMSNAFKNCTSLTSVQKINDTVTDMGGAFADCRSLVNAPNIPNGVTSIYNTFRGCSSLVNAPEIPNSVTNMVWTFGGCSSLVNVPTIPNSVSTIWWGFAGCYSLVNAPTIPNSITSMSGLFATCSSLVNAPTIPNSITSMSYAFSGCSSLVNVSVIPDRVTDMGYTFNGCKLLVNAPEIPNSVTSMAYTFSNCFNLTGDVKIKSEKISNAMECFANTSLAKNVYIPFTYTNGVNTATYNSFISAGYDDNGSSCGVYLKNESNVEGPILWEGEMEFDWSKRINVGGSSSNVEKWTPTLNDKIIITYEKTSKYYTFQVLDSSWTEIELVDDGIVYITSDILKRISDGFMIKGSSFTLKKIELVRGEETKLTINPTPSDATVTLTAEGFTQLGNSITVDRGTTVSVVVSKSGYTTNTNELTIYNSKTLNVSLSEEGEIIDLSKLVLGNRLCNCATVVGNYTDDSNQKYVYAILDSNYMSTKQWSTENVDTSLTNYGYGDLSVSESATYNTDTILNEYEASSYPLFNYVNELPHININGKSYSAKIPNNKEMYTIWQNREILSTYDPTYGTTNYDLVNWTFNGIGNAWSSNEINDSRANAKNIRDWSWSSTQKSSAFGVIPIFELPIIEVSSD